MVGYFINFVCHKKRSLPEIIVLKKIGKLISLRLGEENKTGIG